MKVQTRRAALNFRRHGNALAFISAAWLTHFHKGWHKDGAEKRSESFQFLFSSLSSECDIGQHIYLKKSWNCTLTYTNHYLYNLSYVLQNHRRYVTSRQFCSSTSSKFTVRNMFVFCFLVRNKMHQVFTAVTQPETTFTLPGCCRAVCWLFFFFLFPWTTTRSIPLGRNVKICSTAALTHLLALSGSSASTVLSSGWKRKSSM